MTPYWQVPESCRPLPATNCPERLGVASTLISILRGRKDSAPESDRRTEWTKWIKEGLFGAQNEGLNISPTGAESNAEEFMSLDFCCEEAARPKRILLVAESELDNSKESSRQVEHDFEKLLAVKSPYKLVVYSSRGGGSTNEAMIKTLESSLQNYGHHLQGETYIFIDYNEKSGDHGSFIAHTWQPESNGSQEQVRLVLAV